MGVRTMEDMVKQNIFSVISREVALDFNSIDPNADLREQVNMDSMQFVAVLARLEKEFGIEIPISAMEATTLNEFLSIVGNEMLPKAG
jgi:acyl carrier protein